MTRVATAACGRIVVFVLAASLWVAAACATRPSAAQLERDNPIRPNASPPYGMEEFFKDAPVQPVPARARLGRWLFYDTRLSGDGTVSCASCHRPAHGFSEPTATATGVGGRRGTRKTPSLVNLAARTVLPHLPDDTAHLFFWDGRATGLEAQVLTPIANPEEMGLAHQAMVERFSGIAGYRSYFRDAFGSEAITPERVASALADYVRTRMSGNAPYDQWAYGKDGGAMTAQQQRGSDIFFFSGNCATCHAGFNFSDGAFHNLGLGWNEATQSFADEGRARVTGKPGDRGKFKTPGLREVSRRAPYMHDASLATLREVVEFYNRGGLKAPGRTPRLRPLNLSEAAIDDLVAFLHALDGEGYQDQPPSYFPR